MLAFGEIQGIPVVTAREALKPLGNASRGERLSRQRKNVLRGLGCAVGSPRRDAPACWCLLDGACSHHEPLSRSAIPIAGTWHRFGGELGHGRVSWLVHMSGIDRSLAVRSERLDTFVDRGMGGQPTGIVSTRLAASLQQNR